MQADTENNSHTSHFVGQIIYRSRRRDSTTQLLTKAWHCEKQAGSEDAFILIPPSCLYAHSILLEAISGYFRTQAILKITVINVRRKQHRAENQTVKKAKLGVKHFSIGFSVVKYINAQISL